VNNRENRGKNYKGPEHLRHVKVISERKLGVKRGGAEGVPR